LLKKEATGDPGLFPMESALSGCDVARGERDRFWHRRLPPEVPKDWAGQRVLLHLAAVNWESVAEREEFGDA